MDLLIVHQEVSNDKKERILNYMRRIAATNPSEELREMADHIIEKIIDKKAKYLVFQCKDMISLGTYKFYRMSCWIRPPSTYVGACSKSMPLSIYMNTCNSVHNDIRDVIITIWSICAGSLEVVSPTYIGIGDPKNPGEYGVDIETGGLDIGVSNSDRGVGIVKINAEALINNQQSNLNSQNYGKDQLQGEKNSRFNSRKGCILYGGGDGLKLTTGRHCDQAGYKEIGGSAGGYKIHLSVRTPEILKYPSGEGEAGERSEGNRGHQEGVRIRKGLKTSSSVREVNTW